LFERGFRGAQSRGRGLGLYLVQRITERLDWKISVQSTPGAGTRFEVVFNNRH
jgi:signal transduction histidine kinase